MSLRFVAVAAITLATISAADAGPFDAAAAGAVTVNSHLSWSAAPAPIVLAAPQLLAAPPVFAAPMPIVRAAPAAGVSEDEE